MAIVIPKYKFVDIPMAKEVPHKQFDYSKKVEIKDQDEDHHNEHEDHEDHYEEDDDIDQHNHKMLEDMNLKKRSGIDKTSSVKRCKKINPTGMV